MPRVLPTCQTQTKEREERSLSWAGRVASVPIRNPEFPTRSWVWSGFWWVLVVPGSGVRSLLLLYCTGQFGGVARLSGAESVIYILLT